MQLIALLIPALATAIGPLGPAESDAPLTDRERAVHLLSRFTFGPGPGDVERVLELGVEAWIEEQLADEPLGPPSLSKRLHAIETLEMRPSEISRHIYYKMPANPTRKDNVARNLRRRIPKIELISSIALRSILSTRQLEEVLCDFWRNHLNVSYTKTFPAELYVTSYERQVIQDNVLGDFPTMLTASAHHPAMMHYLDNALSRKPPSNEELWEKINEKKKRGGS